jgi:mono/diheme cytochrome c family protein
MPKEKCKKAGRGGHMRCRPFCIFPFAFCILLSGCSGCNRDTEPYPPTFSYSPRTDWLVIEPPKDVPAEFEPNGELEEAIRRINARGGKVLDPATAPPPMRDELDAFIRDTFGSPAQPTVGGDEESKALAASLGLSDENLAAGSKLFRSRCQECHGPNGDGRGPNAPWVVPHPRDFRQGAFKFTSTGRKPTRADLFRTLTYGLPTTQMPSFGMRTEEQRNQLIDYVMFLSLRGRTEFEVLWTLLVRGEEGLDGTVAADAAAALKRELRAWKQADAEAVNASPPAVADGSPELSDSIRRGHALFLDAKGAACAACHVNYGREAKFQYDVWGTVVRPANLTELKRKAGDSPTELYRRIRCGINPANMPTPTGLSEAQTWDVVHFLRALPYPNRLPDDVRERVYPESK